MIRKYGKWHILPEDPYDETGAPEKPGFYEIILEDGTQTFDYFYAEPTFTTLGCGYWRESTQRIRAWAEIKE